MAISRGESPRSPWLLKLLISLVLIGAVQGRPSGQPAVCGQSCCSVLPSCVEAKKVTCYCPEVDKMIFRKEDIPATAQEVTIHNTGHVILEEDAIGDLPFLVNFTVSDVGQLEIRRGGMASHNQTRLRSVLFQNVSSLQAESHSFSGIWQAEIIRMRHIKDLHVMSNAFSYQAAETGPSVSLQNVHRLNLESNGFSAPMFGMYLTNVNMSECQKDSFGGNTYLTEWNNVAITDMHAKCFHSLKHVGPLNLNSVKIETIRRGAFSGDIRSLFVQNSHFGTVEKSGINMRVSNMEVCKSTIDELKSEGINVFAKDSFKMQRNTIKNLRKNAFARVNMKPGDDGYAPPIELFALTILQAENGSLTFRECSEVRLKDLDLTAPNLPICPTEMLTRALSTGGTDGPLSPVQYALFFQLWKLNWCSEDTKTELPDSAERPSCEEVNEWTPDSLEEDRDDAGAGDDDAMPNQSNKVMPTATSSGVKEHAADDKVTGHNLEESAPAADIKADESSVDEPDDDRRGLHDHISSDGFEHSSVDGELDEGHRMTVYVAVGAFLMLLIVLTVAFSAVIIGKKPKRGQQFLANIHQEEALLKVVDLVMAGTNKMNANDVRGSTESVSSQLSQPHIYAEIDAGPRLTC